MNPITRGMKLMPPRSQIEPKLYKARKVQNLYDNVLYDAPTQYKPKIKFYKRLKEACAGIPVQEGENETNDL